MIAQKYSDEFVEKIQVRYTIKGGDDELVRLVDEAGKSYTTAQVAAFVLQRMKETAENNLGSTVRLTA